MNAAKRNAPTPAIEEYLESIYKLEIRGLRVIGARLAEDLGVSPPTVTEMIRRMADEGFITVTARKEIGLTDRGREAAEVLIRRHRLSERLLTDILGFPWSLAHEEACRFEHVISPAVEERLAKTLDHPATCPHGNPIPGSSGSSETCIRLSEAPAGVIGEIRCVEGEDEELLTYVESLGLLPGVRIEVVGFAPMEGPVEVKVDGASRFVAVAAAERLLMAETG